MNRKTFYLLLGFVAITITCAIYYFKDPGIFTTTAIDAIPEDASFIFCLHSGYDALRTLRQTSFWKTLSLDQSISSADYKFRTLDSLLNSHAGTAQMWKNEKTYVSIHPTKARDFDFLTVFKISKEIKEKQFLEIIENSKIENLKLKTREYADIKIHELWKNNTSIAAAAFSEGLLVLSSTSFLVEASIRHLKKGSSIQKSNAFQKVQLKQKNSQGIELYINHFGLQQYLKTYTNPSYTSLIDAIGSFSRWDGLSLVLNSNTIDFQGSTASKDTSDLVLAFRNQQPVESGIHKFLPARTAFSIRFASDNLALALTQMHSNNLFFDQAEYIMPSDESKTTVTGSEIDNLMKPWLGNEIALFITEPAGNFPDNNAFAIVHARDAKLASTSLQSLQKKMSPEGFSEIHRGIYYGKINYENLLSKEYGKLFRMIKNPCFVVYKDYVIFSNQITSLKALIDDIENKRVLASTLNKEGLADYTTAANIGLYINFPRSINLLNAITNPALAASIEQKKTIWNTLGTLQLNLSYGKSEIKFNAKKQFNRIKMKEVNLVWSVELDTLALSGPYLIDAGKGNYSVVAQDQNNALYNFDESGNLNWKINLGEPVLSKIHAVDYYKNGSLQLLFNTVSKLYMIDANGENTSRYPIRLPAKAENGVALLDIDGRNQKFSFIACDNGQIYAYEISGKPLANWQADRTFFGVKSELRLVKKNSHRYLLIKNNQGLFLADRRGKTKGLATFAGTESESFHILQQDSTGTSTILLEDSLNIISVSMEGQKKLVRTLKESELLHTWVGSNQTDKMQLGVLYNDSIVLKDASGRSLCSTTLKNLDSFEWQHTEDNLFSSKTGLISALKNEFILIEPGCNISSGFPIQGSGKFSIWQKSQTNTTVIAIGSNDRTIYIYHLE
ncbi:MAG: hypothetical protein KA444_01905 [Bacteroidia bacterium]|nr:hypothetical protein [Bacteroidia bacterium]